MKRFVPIIMFNLCLIVPLLAQDDAATVKTPVISLWGGGSIPYLPEYSRQWWKNGWNIGGGYGYDFSPGSVGYSSLLLTAQYARFAFDVNGTLTNLNLLQKKVSLTRNPTTIFDAMLCYKGAFSPGPKTPAPYFLFGIGFLHYSEGAVTATGDTSFTNPAKSQSAFGWTVGAGVEYPVTEMIRVFAQVKSTLGVTDPTRQYFPISGGISYRLGSR